jgi:hypothetical protein
VFARAIVAYQAYGESVDWKNYLGLPMPRWDDLPPAIKQAWQDAADAVCREFGATL